MAFKVQKSYFKNLYVQKMPLILSEVVKNSKIYSKIAYVQKI